MAKNGRFEYTIGFKTDESGLQKAKQALKEIQSLTTASIKGSSTQYLASDLQTAKEAAHQLESALERAGKTASGAINVSALSKELNKLPLKDLYNDLAKIGPKGTNAFRDIATQILKTNTYVKQGNALLKSFGNILIRNVEWLISGNLINSITGVFHKAYGYTKSLDTSLNNIRIVTGASADEMARFGKEAQQMASTLGKTTTDVTNASLIYFQQGLGEEEVKRRTGITEKLSNVTGQSAEQVADQLTAVWNGMGASNDELERYADIMVKVAANTASSSSELSGAISKVAAIAKTTGVDMEQLTSMMSTVIAVTRESPETVGTAFKTIFARMDDLVEDGTDEFGVSLGRVSSHLKAMGIEILNEDGTLRDLGDTLTETGNKWNTYSKEQQVAIAEQMGGKRQWNQVLTLFDHWDEYVNTLGLAKEATGALNEQNDIAMESIEHHLNKLTTAWEGLYGELMSEDVAITVVDDFTKIVNVLGTMVKVAGGGIPLLGSLGAMLLNTFSDKVSERILSIKNNFSMMIESIRQNAAKNEISNMFGSQIANDPGMQQLVQANKEIIRYRSVMTGQDAQMKNNLLERMKNQLAEVDILKDQLKEVQAIQKEYSGVENTVMDLSDLSKVNMEELEEKIGLVKEHIGGIQTHIEELKTNGLGNINFSVLTATSIDADANGLTGLNQKGSSVQGLTDAVKDSKRADIELTEQQTQALERLATTQQEYYNAVKAYNEQDPAARTSEQVQIIKDLENNYKLAGEAVESNTELMKNLTQAATHGFSNLNQEVKKAITQSKGLSAFEKGLAQSSKVANKLALYLKTVKENGLLTEKSMEKVEKAFKKINPTNVNSVAKVWRTLRSELQKTGTDLSTVDQAIKKNLTQELENAKSKIKQLQNECQKLKQDLQFKNAVQGFTQTFAGVTQLTFAMQSLNNAFKTLEDEEATTAEKAGALLMAFSQLGNGVSATFQGISKLGTGLQDGVAAIGKLAKKTAELDEAEKGLTAAQELANDVTGKSTGEKALNAAATEVQKGAENAHAGSTGLEAGAKIGETNAENVNTVAKGANVTMTWKQVAATAAHYAEILLIVGALALLAYGIYKANEAQKEAEEAEKKLNKTREEFIQKNKELIKTIDENVKAFGKFSEVWDSFKQGIATIDEVKQAFQDMAEQLGVAEDEEYKRLARIAEYTNDYAPLEAYLDNIIKKQKQVAAGAAGQSATAYKDELEGAATVENEAVFHERDDSSGWRKKMGAEQEKQWSEALGTLEQAGAIKNVNFGKDYITWSKDTLTADSLIALGNERENIERWANSTDENLKQLGEYYLALINRHSTTVDLWKNATLESIIKEKEENFSKDLGEGNVTQKQNLRKQIDEETQDIIDTYEKEGTVLSKEEKEKIRQQLLADYADTFPDKTAIVGAINTDDELLPALQEELNNSLEAAEMVLHYSLGRFSKDEVQAIEDSLNKVDLKSTQIDWSSVIQDTALMEKILQHKGELTEEDIENLKKYQIETNEQINYLTQNYNELSAKYDEFNSKIEKGSFNAKTFNSKAFQEFFTDDVKDELTELYGKTSDVGQAIEMLSNEAIVGSEEWKEAWKVFGTALDNAEITQDVQNAQTALNQLNSHVKELDDREIHIFAGVSVEEAEQEVDNFVNAQRTIDIDINVKAESKANAIKDTLKDVQKLGSKIDENLQMSFDDFVELEQQFPEIGKGMQVLADGTIQLSQTAVDEAKKQQKENIAIAVDEQIAKIEIEKTLLEEKKKKYEEAAKKAEEFATKAAKGDYDTEAKLQADLNEMQGYYDDLQDISERQERAEEIQLQKDQVGDWKNYYDSVAELDAAYNKLRIRNAHEITEEQVKSEIDIESTPKAASFYTKTSQDIINQVSQKGETETYQEWSDRQAKALENVDLDQNAIKEYWDGVADAMNKGAEDVQSSWNELDALQGNLSRFKELYSNQASRWGNNTDAIKDNTKATKDNAEAQQKLLDLLNEEIDAYHDIDVKIQRINTDLERLKKRQEKLTGQTLLNNLDAQLEKTKELNQNLRERQDLQFTEARVLSVQLEAKGITFNDDGTIANYSQRLNDLQNEINDTITWYNGLSKEDQEANEQFIEDKQKEFDDLSNLIKEYDELWNSKIPSLADEITENLDQQIELEITKVNAEVQIVVDKQSLQRSELELQKALSKIKEDDLIGNVVFDVKTLSTYQSSDGELEAYRKRFYDVQHLWEETLGKGEEPSAQLRDLYKTALEEYTTAAKTTQDLTDKVTNYIIEAYDKVGDALAKQKDNFSIISEIIKHDITLVQLKFGEKAYSQLERLYTKRTEMAEKNLQAANYQVENLRQELLEAQQLGLDENIIDGIKDKLFTAFKEQSQAVEDYINTAQEQATNAINAVFEHLDEQLAGSSLESLKTEWDRINDASDMYLDTVNGAYEIEKLRNQMKKAINETDDVATQKALSSLMNDQISQLKQKDRLSKYDIDRANALFDIEQKRAAFREAQNNKSKMRLRRDASGNYSYQFVSDEDRITSAMQDLADAQNQLYNLDKDSYKNNLDTLYKYYEEWQNAMKDSANLSAEERAKIDEHYQNLILNLMEDNADISVKLQDTALSERERLTGESLENLTEMEKHFVMREMVPIWGTGMAQMGRSLDLFSTEAAAAIAEVFNISDQQSVLAETAVNSIGKSFEEITEGGDNAIATIESMMDSTEELIITMQDLVEQVKELVNISDPKDLKIQSYVEREEKSSTENEIINETVLNAQQVDSLKLEDKTRGSFVQQLDKGAKDLESFTPIFLSEQQQNENLKDWASLMDQKTLKWMLDSYLKYEKVIMEPSENQNLNQIPSTQKHINAIIQRLDYGQALQGQEILTKYSNSINNAIQNINDIVPNIDSHISELSNLLTELNAKDKIMNVTANFPNVNSKQEIEEAFRDLTNIATQKAFKTLR